MLVAWVGGWMVGQTDKGHLRAIPLVLEVPMDSRVSTQDGQGCAHWEWGLVK